MRVADLLLTGICAEAAVLQDALVAHGRCTVVLLGAWVAIVTVAFSRCVLTAGILVTPILRAYVQIIAIECGASHASAGRTGVLCCALVLIVAHGGIVYENAARPRVTQIVSTEIAIIASYRRTNTHTGSA